jgi:xanthine dehydrogenase accessory factor
LRPAELHARIAELSEQGVPFVLATITEVTGSSPRGVGAKMLVFADGSIAETIGGGVLERQVIDDARSCLASGVSRSEQYELREKGERALGSLCGGQATVFFDVHTPDRALLIVGAGHVGQKLSSLGRLLDFQVIVLDPRQDMVTRARFPDADQLIHGEPARTSELVPIGATTHVVIVTHGHAEDAAALRSVLDSGAGSVGMIGSVRKVHKIFEQLRAEGVTEERLEAIHAPVGLDIGAETPAELALSIMAEIVAGACGRLNGRETTPMSAAGEAQ